MSHTEDDLKTGLREKGRRPDFGSLMCVIRPYGKAAIVDYPAARPYPDCKVRNCPSLEMRGGLQ